MNGVEFEALFDAVTDDLRNTLFSKAKEYASDGDRMHNFKRAGAMNQETPEQALWGMNTKHIVSLMDMIDSEKSYPEAVWREKLVDYLNYGILLWALAIDTERLVFPSTVTADSGVDSTLRTVPVIVQPSQ